MVEGAHQHEVAATARSALGLKLVHLESRFLDQNLHTVVRIL
jgi:hypothetical protein